MNRAGRYGLYGALGTWSALTVVLHTGGRGARLVAFVDPFGTTVPMSKFFAPRPGNTDKHLLVRDELADGTLTPWSEYVLVAPRTARHLVWHPGRREEKGLLDAVLSLLRVASYSRSFELLQLTTPYLILLTVATYRCPHHPGARRLQFMVVTSCGRDERAEPVVQFLSELHELP